MANDMFNKLGTNEFFNINQINNFHAHEFEKVRALLLSKATTPKAIICNTSKSFTRNYNNQKRW